MSAKPCPFCGAHPVVMTGIGFAQLYCSNPRCSSGNGSATPEEAMRAWNTRVPVVLSDAQADALFFAAMRMIEVQMEVGGAYNMSAVCQTMREAVGRVGE